MSKLQITYIAPELLRKNPWNPNTVDPINQEKIVESIRTEGFFKPILVRELESGELEILGGEHRAEAAISLGMREVPILNMGRISDRKAKRVGLLDNGRYGEDDPVKMAELLGDGDLGSAEEIISILAIDETELLSYFEHSSVNFDDLEDDIDTSEPDEIPLDLPGKPSVKTHQILRFKVPVEDAERITDMISKIRAEQGFTAGDELTNAGDALVHALFSE